MTEREKEDLQERLTLRANFLEEYQILLMAVDDQLRCKRFPDQKQLDSFMKIVQHYKRKFNIVSDRKALQELKEYCNAVRMQMNIERKGE